LFVVCGLSFLTVPAPEEHNIGRKMKQERSPSAYDSSFKSSRPASGRNGANSK